MTPILKLCQSILSSYLLSHHLETNSNLNEYDLLDDESVRFVIEVYEPFMGTNTPVHFYFKTEHALAQVSLVSVAFWRGSTNKKNTRSYVP